MNLLLDCVSFQSIHSGGGGEYAKKVCTELMKVSGIQLFGFFDSSMEFDECQFAKFKDNHIALVDIHQLPIVDIVNTYHIDKVFLGVQSVITRYDFSKLDCKIIVTLHDLRNHDILLNDIRGRLTHPSGIKSIIKHLLVKAFPARFYHWAYKEIDISLLTRKNVFITTVSDYSKGAIEYYYPELKNKSIPVFFPPLKTELTSCAQIENKQLLRLVEKKTPYFFLVSGNTPSKNVNTFIRVFQRIKKEFPEYKCVITGATHKDFGKNIHSDIIPLGFLSTTDLEQAYANATIFIYPTYQEGFGYPPLEAMKYGVPCCISNVTSLPEVYQDSVLYFSPFYEADIYNQCVKMVGNIKYYRNKSFSCFERVTRKQNADLNKLLEFITSV